MSRNFITLKPTDNARKALHLMRDRKASVILIASKRRILGFVSSLHLLEAGNFPGAKLGSIARPAPSFTSSDTVLDVAKALVSHRMAAVSVLDSKGAVLGIVTSYDIVKYALRTGWLEMFSLKDVMSTDLVTAAPSDPVDKVRRMIVNRRVKQVLIIGDYGKLVGVVGIGNILDKIYGIALSRSTFGEVSGKTSRTLSCQAKSIMARPVSTVDVGDRLSKAAGVMIKGGFAAPVLERGSVVGIVSRSDIVKMIAALDLMPGLPVTFKGFKRIPEHLRDRANTGISRTLERFARTTDLFEGRMIVKQKSTGSGRTLYIFETSAKTAGSMILASKSGWEPIQAFNKALRSLERQNEKVLARKRKAERKNAYTVR